MKLFSGNEDYKLYHGSMLDMLEVIEPNSIDSIVTDPPYELNFMNKGWDSSGIAFQADTWKKCYEVLKPGGYLLAFGGSRTYHRIAVAIEDAGFEIRDTIMWLYGSGMPKSMNLGKAVESKLVNGSANTQDWKNLKGTKVETGDWGISTNSFEYGARPSDYTEDGHMRVDKVDYQTEEGKQWDGWGTSLKPAYEPVIVARKPCDGSTTDNVLKYGVGGINIDECRVGTEERTFLSGKGTNGNCYGNYNTEENEEVTVNGRFPANVILTYDETDEKEVCGGMPDTVSNGGTPTMPDLRDVGAKSKEAIGIDKLSFGQVSNAERKASDYVAPMDSGSAARYFYCAKASKADRDEGLDELPDKSIAFSNQAQAELKRGGELQDGGLNKILVRKNIHPTVKPTTLMQYLVRLVTPKNGTVLDPFNGSGSTGKAVMYENKERDVNYKYVGIELTEEYLPIAQARIEYAIKASKNIVDMPKASEKPINGQVAIWDMFDDE